jgi:hypothetical protein
MARRSAWVASQRRWSTAGSGAVVGMDGDGTWQGNCACTSAMLMVAGISGSVHLTQSAAQRLNLALIQVLLPLEDL